MRNHKIIALGAALTAVASIVPGTAGAQAAGTPRLGLRAASTEVTVDRYPGEPVWLNLGVFVTAEDGAFELRARRPAYSQPIQLEQRTYLPGGQVTDTVLDPGLLDGWHGLKDFFSISIVDRDGNEVVQTTLPFCPNAGGRERLNDDGPSQPSYPEACYANPFTKGVIWGIDDGWAVDPFAYGQNPLDLDRGRYTVTTSVTAPYVELFNVGPAAVTQQLRVRNVTFEDCIKCYGRTSGRSMSAGSGSAAPIMEDPDPAILPDLVAMPAWGISVDNRRKRSFLSFGATVWTAGNDSMVVEGFRRNGEDIMDAYQYFHSDGEVVGRAPVGAMEFDTEPSHNHWHFLQFAGYSLVAADGSTVRSRKEAFCLAPTDAVDMTIENAVVNPGRIGVGSACGAMNSIWVREVLPLGWGDTYFQGIPGQSFNITNLPNGSYHIRVEANPTGSLFEQSSDNNSELREVILKGKPGNRRVIVPPWNGIDTEQDIRYRH